MIKNAKEFWEITNSSDKFNQEACDYWQKNAVFASEYNTFMLKEDLEYLRRNS
jgi:hypothetical protein